VDKSEELRKTSVMSLNPFCDFDLSKHSVKRKKFLNTFGVYAMKVCSGKEVSDRK
jgi:hypothetical protein